MLSDTGGEARIYLKSIPADELAAETLCAVVGRAMGLPIPRPYLVDDPEGHLAGEIASEGLPLFGSEDAEYPSVRRWVTEQEHPAVEHALLKWQYVREAAVFDEWIVNWDRSRDNLLFDGERDFWMIDHGNALDGPSWSSRKLDPQVAPRRNMLAERLLTQGRELESRRLHDKAGDFRGAQHGCDWAAIPQLCLAPAYGMDDALANAAAFLKERTLLLPALMRARGNEPELKL